MVSVQHCVGSILVCISTSDSWPALLTRTCSAPYLSIVALTILEAKPSAVTSPGTLIASPPASLISDATCKQCPLLHRDKKCNCKAEWCNTCSDLLLSMSVTTTLAPCSAKSLAAAAPTPWPEPVMIATCRLSKSGQTARISAHALHFLTCPASIGVAARVHCAWIYKVCPSVLLDAKCPASTWTRSRPLAMLACLCCEWSVFDAKYASKPLRKEIDGAQSVRAMSLRKTSRQSADSGWPGRPAWRICMQEEEARHYILLMTAADQMSMS